MDPSAGFVVETGSIGSDAELVAGTDPASDTHMTHGLTKRFRGFGVTLVTWLGRQRRWVSTMAKSVATCASVGVPATSDELASPTAQYAKDSAKSPAPVWKSVA